MLYQKLLDLAEKHKPNKEDCLALQQIILECEKVPKLEIQLKNKYQLRCEVVYDNVPLLEFFPDNKRFTYIDTGEVVTPMHTPEGYIKSKGVDSAGLLNKIAELVLQISWEPAQQTKLTSENMGQTIIGIKPEWMIKAQTQTEN